MLQVNQLAGFGAVGTILRPDEIAPLWGWWNQSTVNVSGSSVVSWSDASGNGRTLTHNGAAPDWVASGGPGGVGGYVDIDCYSVSGDERLAGTETAANRSSFHVFAVMNVRNWTGQNGAEGFLVYGGGNDSAGTSTKGLVVVRPSYKIGVSVGGANLTWSAAQAPLAGSWALVETYGQSNTKLGVNINNGTPVEIVPGNIGNNIDGIVLGNQGAENEGYDVSFSEMIVYPAYYEIYSSQRSATLGYLINRFGPFEQW